MDTVIKAAAVYAFLWAMLRLTGRRTVGEMTIFEFVLLLIMGGATQRALTGEDYSLINAAILVVTLLTLNVAVSLLESRFPFFARISKGVPTIIVQNGQPLMRRMRWARLSQDDVMETARRRHGLERMSEIKFAILETSGEISIIPMEDAGKRPRKPRAPSVAAKN